MEQGLDLIWNLHSLHRRTFCLMLSGSDFKDWSNVFMWQEIGRWMSGGRGKGVNQLVTVSNTHSSHSHTS